MLPFCTRVDLGAMAMKGTLHSLKLQHHWNLAIRLFSVISRTLIGRGLTPLQSCSWCILQPQPTGQTDIKKIRLKWFGHRVHKNNASNDHRTKWRYFVDKYAGEHFGVYTDNNENTYDNIYLLITDGHIPHDCEIIWASISTVFSWWPTQNCQVAELTLYIPTVIPSI